MTWVIGMRTMFGYSIGLSDVRVTAADGRFVDCLQKVYPVGRDIILGFAGSVSIGFKMVRRMATLMSQAPPDQGWGPAGRSGLVARGCPRSVGRLKRP
jgi:hypothetical protein